MINNKIKQFIGGNWGKPQGLEQHIKLKNFDLEPQHLPNKKKKHNTNKQKYIFEGFCCPFCHSELPLDENLIAKKKLEFQGKSYKIWEDHYRVKVCPKCGAAEIKECPACKCETWHHQDWYKHNFLGCGFNGKRIDPIRHRQDAYK